MEKVELIIENSQSRIAVDDKLEKMIKAVVLAAISLEKFQKPVEISVTLVDNEQIREINREYRDKDMVTDVLSFPMLEFDENHQLIAEYEVGDYNYDDEVLLLGDIVISLERAKEQAEEYGHSFEREVGFLTAHSMFHLFGYDHENEHDREVMRSREEAVLEELGLTR